MSVSSVIKSIQDIMRKDAGVDGDAQRLGQMSWLLFLKIFDAQEEALEFELEDYQEPIPSEYLWRNWAADDEGITGDELLEFVNDQLFSNLKNLIAPINKNPRGFVVREAFSDAFNYMKNGTLLRQVINKLNEIDFTDSKERHLFGDLYEQILKDLQSAGNAGEFYTPRAITRFIVDRIDPKLGESIMDPACGTGGFLACSFDHVKDNYVKTAADHQILQKQIHGVEKKQLPHLLCTTNMLLHGIEVPLQIKHGNTLNKPLASWDEEIDVIVSNPPFGGTEEDGIEKNFPSELQTRETADLFLQLIIEVLASPINGKQGGRAAVVLPDGTLFGEGVKTKIKQLLTEECNLHTIIRLPNGVFNPYTGIKTNILFFTKGTPTKDIWFYEHPYPAGVTSYNKTKPMKFEEFQAESDWWGSDADDFASRVENAQAWKVDFVKLKEQAKNNAEPHWQKSRELYLQAEQMKPAVEQEKALLKQLKKELSDYKKQLQSLNKETKTGEEINLTAVEPLKADIVSKEKAEIIQQSKTDEVLAQQTELKQQATEQQNAGDAIFNAIFNFDIKNPHVGEVISHDAQELLTDYAKQQDDIQVLRDQLKGILSAALTSESNSEVK